MRIQADPDPPPYFLRKKTQWYGITKFSLIFISIAEPDPLLERSTQLKHWMKILVHKNIGNKVSYEPVSSIYCKVHDL